MIQVRLKMSKMTAVTDGTLQS